MADSNRLAGTAYLAINGKSMALAGDFAYQVSTPTREALVGQDGYHGYSEKPGHGVITATLRNSDKVSLTDLGNLVAATITVELANGKTVIGGQMFTTEKPKAKADDAGIEIEWHGPSVTEMVS